VKLQIEPDILQSSSGQSFAVNLAGQEKTIAAIDHVIGLSGKDLGLAADVLGASGIDVTLVEETRRTLIEMLDGDYRQRAKS